MSSAGNVLRAGRLAHVRPRLESAISYFHATEFGVLLGAWLTLGAGSAAAADSQEPAKQLSNPVAALISVSPVNPANARRHARADLR